MPHRSTKIISDDDRIVDAIRDRQLIIRAQLDARLISLKGIAFDSGIGYSTLLSYFPGEKDKHVTALPVAALFRLIPVLPADLIGLLLPEGYSIVKVPEGIDHDELAAGAIAYAAGHARARHPASPGGVDITPEEDTELAVSALRIGRAA